MFNYNHKVRESCKLKKKMGAIGNLCERDLNSNNNIAKLNYVMWDPCFGQWDPSNFIWGVPGTLEIECWCKTLISSSGP